MKLKLKLKLQLYNVLTRWCAGVQTGGFYAAAVICTHEMVPGDLDMMLEELRQVLQLDSPKHRPVLPIVRRAIKANMRQV